MFDTKYAEILFAVSLFFAWLSFKTKNKTDNMVARSLFFVAVAWLIADFTLAIGLL